MDNSSDITNKSCVRSPSKRKRNDSVSISSTPAELHSQQEIAAELDARLQTHNIKDAPLQPDPSVNHDALPSTPPEQIFSIDAAGIPGSASPRTVVARQFEDLDIRTELSSAQPPQTKKTKTNRPNNNAQLLSSAALKEPGEPLVNAAAGGPVKPLPWLKTRQALVPEASQSSAESAGPGDAPKFLLSSPIMDDNDKDSPDVAGMSSNSTEGLQIPGTTPFTFTSPIISPRALSPTPDQESQFWSLSEITGHDPDDPDDDGTGINGVGFKPTAAMAAVRSSKRKQQVESWRKREAEDARRRRAEIRSGALLNSGIRRAESRERSNTNPIEKVQKQENAARRMVRFAT